MPTKLTQLLKSIPSLGTTELNKVLSKIQTELNLRDKKNFLHQIPNFCSDKSLLDDVWKECDSFNLGQSKRKCETQWLCPNNEAYIYNDVNPIHHAIDITKYPAISKVLDAVNADPNVTGPLDSCLVLKYSAPTATLSPHADDEEQIDQSKAICTLSLGASRVLSFFDKDSNKPVTNIDMDHNRLLVMKPGTQSSMKHRVDKGENDSTSKIRYVLSFRALTSLRDTTPVKKAVPVTVVSSNEVTPNPVTRHMCLIAGDSYAARLDTKRLGRNVLAVESVAKGGAKLEDVEKQLKEYHSENPNAEVDKLILSVGTNDIRNCRNGVNHLRGPLKQLCESVKKLYPSSKVYFQSLLPLPCLHKNDWNTNRNVLEFNRFIFNECIFRRFYFIDAFSVFRAPWNMWSPHLRCEQYFEVNGIHSSTGTSGRGMSILAKLYIRALHSKYFNPHVFQ